MCEIEKRSMASKYIISLSAASKEFLLTKDGEEGSLLLSGPSILPKGVVIYAKEADSQFWVSVEHVSGSCASGDGKAEIREGFNGSSPLLFQGCSPSNTTFETTGGGFFLLLAKSEMVLRVRYFREYFG